ncbi:MAG: hypothetical protein AAF206_04395 [Bacteroidota bacterium]
MHLARVFLLLLLMGLIMSNTFAQKKVKVYNIFCATFSDGALNGLQTLTINQAYFKGKDVQGVSIEHIFFTGKDFVRDSVIKKVQELSKTRGAICFFHLFDHGLNKGELLPHVQCYQAPDDIQPSVLINPEKDILGPFKKGKAKFAFAYIDACNDEMPYTRNIFRQNPNEQAVGIPFDRIYQKLVDPKLRKKILTPLKVDKNYQEHPLGLLLSAKGYVGISSSGLDQRAFTVDSVGGIGSAWIFQNLTEILTESKQVDWIRFLGLHRQSVDESVHYFDPALNQRPIWIGRINGSDLPSPLILYPDIDTIKLSQIAAQKSRESVTRFCHEVNLLKHKSRLRRLDPANALSFAQSKNVIVFDEYLSFQSGNAGYNKLSTYLENHKKFQHIRSDFDLSSIFYEGQVQYRNRKQLAYRVNKRIQTGNKVDTLQMRILTRKKSPLVRFNKKKHPGYAVSKVSTLPPVPKPVYENEEELFQPIEYDLPALAEERFRSGSFQRASQFFGLVKRAAKSFRNFAGPERIIREAMPLFKNVDSTSIGYSSHQRRRNLNVGVEDYFQHFQKEFTNRYDSVFIQLCDNYPIKSDEDSTVYLTPIDSNRWVGQSSYIQLFKGYKKKRRQYYDLTYKVIEYEISGQQPSGINEEPQFETLITDVKVIKTVTESECPNSFDIISAKR